MYNKVCVITGAGGLLCSAFANEMAKNGYSVALIDIDEEAAERVCDEVCMYGGLAKAYPADVLDRDALEAVRKKIVMELGKCTVLINGAGGNVSAASTAHEYYEAGDEKREDIPTFFNLDSPGYDFVFDLNMKGTLIPTQVFSKDMINGEGCSVVNITSMDAYAPMTKSPVYGSAKAALSNFTRWLAVHFAKAGIRVNAIAPGFFAEVGEIPETVSERAERILDLTPMGRFGHPDELLGVLRFLTDPTMSSYVTGVVIPVDGGFSAYSGV